MRLLMFDIDGTLTRTNDVDTRCYVQAITKWIDVDEIDTDWASYPHVTDSGVAAELFRRHHGKDPTEQAIKILRSHFVTILSQAFLHESGACNEVPGAAVMIERVMQHSNLMIAFATGGWGASARLKLDQARIPFHDAPFASADDAPTREEIMRIAHDKAIRQSAIVAFESVVYIGDAVWDVTAARNLGYQFIGITCDGDKDHLSVAGATTTFPDFRDFDRFIETVLRL